MVEHILDQIISPRIYFRTEVNICRSSHLSTFVKESNYLYKVDARLYPSANPSSGGFRKRSIYADGCGYRGDRRGGRLNGRVCGKVSGGRGG